jgi:hypothetical protein
MLGKLQKLDLPSTHAIDPWGDSIARPGLDPVHVGNYYRENDLCSIKKCYSSLCSTQVSNLTYV